VNAASFTTPPPPGRSVGKASGPPNTRGRSLAVAFLLTGLWGLRDGGNETHHLKPLGKV
jgi:hypothetical protein